MNVRRQNLNRLRLIGLNFWKLQFATNLLGTLVAVMIFELWLAHSSIFVASAVISIGVAFIVDTALSRISNGASQDVTSSTKDEPGQSSSEIALAKLQTIRARMLQLQNALDRSAIVLRCLPNGDVIETNENFKKLIGRELKVSDNIYNLSLFHDRLFKHQACSITNEQIAIAEVTGFNYENKKFSLEGIVSPQCVDGAGTETESLLAIFFDVSIKKNLELRIVESAQLAALGEMAGGVAHEINNPLAVIKSKAQFLIQQLSNGRADTAKVTDGLSKIDKTVDRIAVIVSGLLTISRDTKDEPARDALIRSVIDDCLTFTHEKFKNGDIALEIICDPNLMARCKPVQVSQAILNLLNNSFDAVKFLAERWVRIEGCIVGDKVRITVRDSGQGIPQAVLQKMMQPFFTTKEIGKGTGLGLSISKSLIEEQSGSFGYDQTAANTTFFIELPAANVADSKIAS